MRLLSFLTKQSRTIARLRGRIVRLSTIIQSLTVQPGDVIPNVNAADLIPHTASQDQASVLVDTHLNASFLLKPNCDTKVEMRSLDYTKIKNNSKFNWPELSPTKTPKMNYGCTLTQALLAQSFLLLPPFGNTFRHSDLPMGMGLVPLETAHLFNTLKRVM
jgi:hypothetical protein